MLNIKDKIPTTLILLLFSWLIAILGLIASIYLIIFNFKGVSSIANSSFILLGSLFLAVVTRMFANIGQMLFDLKKETVETKYINLNYLEQINCDLKDINQDINQIKTFFEQIERHLDLKK